MICVAFFFQILPNLLDLHQLLDYFSNLNFTSQIMAQLVVRLPGRHEVLGSNPG